MRDSMEAHPILNIQLYRKFTLMIIRLLLNVISFPWEKLKQLYVYNCLLTIINCGRRDNFSMLLLAPGLYKLQGDHQAVVLVDPFFWVYFIGGK